MPAYPSDGFITKAGDFESELPQKQGLLCAAGTWDEPGCRDVRICGCVLPSAGTTPSSCSGYPHILTLQPSTRLLPCFSAGSWGCSALLAASGMTGCSVRDLRLLTYCPRGRHLQRLRVCWVCSIARPAEQRWHLSPGAPSEPSSGVYCDLHCEVR